MRARRRVADRSQRAGPTKDVAAFESLVQTARGALSTLGIAFSRGLDLKSPETISDATIEVLCAALAHLDAIDTKDDKRLSLACGRLMHALVTIFAVRSSSFGTR